MESSDSGTATTAEPVSWVAGNNTVISNPNSSANSVLKLPSSDLGGNIVWNISESIPKSYINSLSHSLLKAFTNWVEVAFVYSLAFVPVSKKFKKSGRIRNVFACSNNSE